MRSERVGAGGSARRRRSEVVVEPEEFTREEVTAAATARRDQRIRAHAERVRRGLEAARERHRQHHVHERRRAAPDAGARLDLALSWGCGGGRRRSSLQLTAFARS